MNFLNFSYLLNDQMNQKISIFGEAGSGKSLLLREIWKNLYELNSNLKFLFLDMDRTGDQNLEYAKKHNINMDNTILSLYDINDNYEMDFLNEMKKFDVLMIENTGLFLNQFQSGSPGSGQRVMKKIYTSLKDKIIITTTPVFNIGSHMNSKVTSLHLNDLLILIEKNNKNKFKISTLKSRDNQKINLDKLTYSFDDLGFESLYERNKANFIKHLK